jgi:hypothetical protein
MIEQLFANVDKLWVKRKRLLDTLTIVKVLHQTAILRRGLGHVLDMTNITPASAAALCKARHKIPLGALKEVAQKVAARASTPPGTRVLAIDGSKVHVPPRFKSIGFKSRTNEQPVPRPARRPICMMSSMIDVQTKCCVNYEVSSHFNERRAALDLLSAAHEGDTLLFDRGYYSYPLVSALLERNLHFVMRLKCDAFAAAKRFFNCTLNVQPILIQSRPCRLVKYTIDGSKYMCLTSLADDPSAIRKRYAERWRVEEHFKRLKSHLHLDHVNAQSMHSLFQDMEIRVLLDTLSIAAHVRDPSSGSHRPKRKPPPTVVHALHNLFRRQLSPASMVVVVVIVVHHRWPV